MSRPRLAAALALGLATLGAAGLGAAGLGATGLGAAGLGATQPEGSARAEDAAPAVGPDPSLNPVHALDRSTLTGFRDRPLFTPSRRRPAAPEPEPEEDPVVEAAAPPPESPPPNLKLTGVVVGAEGAVAVVQDMDAGETTRLRLGDMTDGGWLVTDIGDVVVRLTLGEREEAYRLFDPAARDAKPAADPDAEE